ncbi:MAG: BREX-1 system phosphatase PglZ type B [Bacteroidetes bacterium]|nr:BREX-1 system phosphatase PglZ type B [Bacteroidota bacterium]
MAETFLHKLQNSIEGAAHFESGSMTRPEVILWLDPEKQWQSIIPPLQQQMPHLLILGDYDKEKRTGPAIWLKCMVSKTLAEATWSERQTPVIYMPGISKQDFKNISNGSTPLLPLMEYQYTGVLWLHRNGKEWTVNAFLMDSDNGLGLKLQQDNATKEAAISALSKIAETDTSYFPAHVNSEFLYSLLFPNETQSILKWLNEKDTFTNSLQSPERAVFTGICQSRYDFIPDSKNIKDIVEKFAQRKNNWQKVWDTFAASPQKFPWVEDLLRQFCPSGPDRFLFPEESFPQINEEREELLRKTFEGFNQLSVEEAANKILELEKHHAQRRNWVWAETGKASLANALQHLVVIAEIISETIPTGSVEEIASYYESKGHKADYAALKALSFGISIANKNALTVAIGKLYSAWLENLAVKFQTLIQKDATVFTNQNAVELNDEFILFVDAFRYDLASAFTETFLKKHKTNLSYTWSALPSLTPTAKPNVSPVAKSLSTTSECNDFRPQTISGKELLHPIFKTELQNLGYKFVSEFSDIEVGKKHWMEIGKIDSTGHTEQSGIVKRIEELFAEISETIETIFANGIRKIKIVTDHGWLLLPTGLPKTELPAYLTETRWGRCALIKEGVKSDLLHLPWRWNKQVLIAYAPCISFFKKNEEYAHGGVSLQECFVPLLTIENGKQQLRNISVNIKWVHLKCSLEISGADTTCKVMIRTKHSDPASIISSSEKNVSHDGRVTLFVEDSDKENSAAFIVITESDGTVIHKQQTIIGE